MVGAERPPGGDDAAMGGRDRPLEPRPPADPEVARVAERLVAAARSVRPRDDGYPAALRVLEPAPGRLWIAGAVPSRCIAVVGSRRPDLGGLCAAREIGAGLARAGWAVVSGGAVGIDAAALEGALDAGGKAVVVLGSGIGKPYPRESAPLLERVAGAGAVVSPFPPPAHPIPGRFLRRNRLIAALGRAAVVVRAGIRSGALSTAAHAEALGRPLLAVPGSTICDCAIGSNDLLRRGRRIAIGAADVLDVLEGDPGPASGSPDRAVRAEAPVRAAPAARARALHGHPDAEALVALLAGGEFASADALAEATGLGAAAAASVLGRLEAEGIVRRTPDGRFGLDARREDGR